MLSSALHRERGGKSAESSSVSRFTASSSLPRPAARLRRFSDLYRPAVLALTVCAIVVFMWTSALVPLDTLTDDAGHATPLASHPPVPAGHGDTTGGGEHAFAVPVNMSSGLVSPNTSVLVPPFKDLCEWVSGTHTLSMVPAAPAMPAAAYAVSDAARAQLTHALDRFEQIPADGGAAGVRWSAATGLPVASSRRGEVKVRFVTVSNRVDATTHFATVAAAMAGARLDVVGMGWKHFSFMKRLSLLASYAELEGLTGADVIVATDADAVMSGEDAESFFAAFVASTAESEAEHMTYSLRDIRTGKRQTPVIFSAESSCFMPQFFSTKAKCAKAYRAVFDLREAWVTSSNETLQLKYFFLHPHKYLNAGVMVSRVWALRQLSSALALLARTAKPKREGQRWWCDQTALAALYLDLLRWELKSHAWDGVPRRVSWRALRGTIFPLPQLPSGGRGPYNMTPGLIDVDRTNYIASNKGAGDAKDMRMALEQQLKRLLSRPADGSGASNKDREGLMPADMSVMGVVSSSHRRTVPLRPGVDCFEVMPNLPPECAYRDAVWGIPLNATAVVPLTWHFSGPKKGERLAQSRTFFPWYTPTLINSGALEKVVHVLTNLPPTRVFLVDPATDTDGASPIVRLLPHNVSHDLSAADVCSVSFSQSNKQ